MTELNDREILDPRLIKIPQSLLDLVGEELARSRLILPYEDDGTNFTLFCPTHPQYGTYGKNIADRYGEKFGREIKWIPIDSVIMKEAVDVHYAAINNCPIQFSFKCPKTWHSLEATDNAKVRYCSGCKSDVYWCDFVSEAKALAKEGKCVAISGRDEANDKGGGVVLGMVFPN